MVDLVKIRRKAKEKKDEAAASAGEPTEARPTAEAPAPPVSPPPSREPEARPKPAASDERGKPEPPSPPALPPALVAAVPATTDKLERFKQTAGLREVIQAGETKVADDGRTLELLLFGMAGEQYAIEIEAIVEIVTPRPATRVPNADPTIVGIISLRGTIVTILDVRRMLGHPPAVGEGPETRMIVVEHEGEIAGFVVDRVWRKVSVDRSEVESHPVVSASEQSEYIRGVFQQGSTLSILLDLERLLLR